MVSNMANTLIGSEIIKLAGEVNQMIAQGNKVFNFTIGDFDPNIFPIPAKLKAEIVNAYHNNETNYPPANGILPLRKAIAKYHKSYQNLDLADNDILVSGGARPLIYATYLALLNPGDKVLYPVPSWNNNHYCHLTSTKGIEIFTTAENNFMPTASELEPYLQEVSLVALCSPLNPTGTTFKAEELSAICQLILAENQRRGPNAKPLYLMYDQIYWQLTYGETEHIDPVTIHPEMKAYTIFIDGISKVFAATGVRVGWAFGPTEVIDKMKALLSHIGAWSPKAEQVATAAFLNDHEAIDGYLAPFKATIHDILDGFYTGFQDLKNKGYSVDAIAPQAAIYLTVKLSLVGKIMPDGNTITQVRAATDYILKSAKIALVPFHAFGDGDDSEWYRLSIGTATLETVEASLQALEKALSELR